MATEAENAAQAERGSLQALAEDVARNFAKGIATLGGLAQMAGQIMRWAVRPPFRVHNMFAQADFVGVGSIFIVSLTGTFTGMVFAQQSSRAFEIFGAESLVGPLVGLTLTRELAPVFTALM